MFHFYKDVIFRLKPQNYMHKTVYFYIFFKNNNDPSPKKQDKSRKKINSYRRSIIIIQLIALFNNQGYLYTIY